MPRWRGSLRWRAAFFVALDCLWRAGADWTNASEAGGNWTNASEAGGNWTNASGAGTTWANASEAGGNWTNASNTTTAAIFRNGTVRVNVTVGGLGLAQALRLPGKWGARVGSEATEDKTGECPAGRYCPGGVGPPRMCSAGSYSPYAGRTKACATSEGCWEGSYCPDPGTMVSCPANTWSGFRSTSQLDCRCKAGYTCIYRKTVNLNMLLHVPMGVWMSESGRTMREKVIQAVAESAGVSPADVQIDQSLPYLTQGTRRLLEAHEGTLTQGRRLLDTEQQPTLLLRLSLRGAEAVAEDALQAKLGQIFHNGNLIGNHKRRTLHTRPRVNWARADRVQVKPKIWLPV